MVHHILEFAAYEQAQVDQHLVVARAARVNFLAHVAKAAGEHQLHLRVHILDAVFNLESARLNLGVDVAQLGGERAQLIGGEQSYGFEHGDVGQRAQHIIARKIHVHFAVAAHRVTLHVVVELHRLFPKF